MENRYITIATLNKSDAGLFSKQLENREIKYLLTEAKAVRVGESDGLRVKVLEKDRKIAIHELEQFIKTYGIKSYDDDLFSHEIERILVPVDFSEYSKNACEFAIGIAKMLDAEIMLLHAYYFPIINAIDYGEGLNFVVGLNETITDIAEKAREGLLKLYDELMDEIRLKNYVNVKLNFTLANGNPVNEIMNMYYKYRPGLIVMGTQGKTKLAREQFGTVAASTINDTKVPVLTIPEISKFKGIGKVNVLYATNFDESDFRAIKKLMTLLYLFDVKINFVHIGKNDEISRDKIDTLKELFNNLYPGYEFECQIVENMDILLALQKLMLEKSIDIIAMTTHKRNFFTQLFKPSMTKKMLFQTDTPMLIFHA